MPPDRHRRPSTTCRRCFLVRHPFRFISSFVHHCCWCRPCRHVPPVAAACWRRCRTYPCRATTAFAAPSSRCPSTTATPAVRRCRTPAVCHAALAAALAARRSYLRCRPSCRNCYRARLPCVYRLCHARSLAACRLRLPCTVSLCLPRFGRAEPENSSVVQLVPRPTRAAGFVHWFGGPFAWSKAMVGRLLESLTHGARLREFFSFVFVCSRALMRNN